jgi:transcriptional regulator with XRE-family HTH domain
MNPDHTESRRLLEVLRTLMRMLAFSHREVERRLGLKHSAVTRLFNGQVEAKLELVLGIVRVIGLEYDELFSFVYPERRAAAAESAAARKIRSLLADLHPPGFSAAPPAEKPLRATPAAEPASRDELLRDLRKVVREVLAEMEAGDSGPEPGKGE